MRKYVYYAGRLHEIARVRKFEMDFASFICLQIEKAPKGASADFPITKQERK